MKISILTEGGWNVGFGHVTRCISIWQGFEEAGIEAKLIVNGDNSVLELLKDKHCEVFDWLRDLQRLFDILKNTDIVFIDSYLAPYELYEQVSKLTKTSVYLDDTQRMEYPPGVILNSGVKAEEIYQPRKKGIDYLLSSRFTPLRKAFWQVGPKIIKEQISDVLITFGGGGQLAFLENLVDRLAKRFDGFTYHIVLPSQVSEDHNFAAAGNVKIYSNLNDLDMCKLMLECDICISGGGQTTYELARVGLATIGICFAENQRANLEGWHTKGFVSYVGWYKDKSLFEKIAAALEELMPVQKRAECSQLGKGLVDGQGVKRIVDYILNAN